MNYLSQINTETIRMAINDALNVYSAKEQIDLRRISDKLRNNPSMYSLYTTEKDQIASAINDALYLLDNLSNINDLQTNNIENHSQNRKAIGGSLKNSESIDKSSCASDANPIELAAYRDELERILEVLQDDSERSPRGE